MTTPVWLCAAEPDDIPELLELDRLCSPHPWTRRHFETALQDDTHSRVLLARSRHAIVACCCIETVLDEVHIHNLAVHPDHRRQGLARLLLHVALALAHRHGATAAYLEVRESNRAARALYASLGFRATGRRRGYYAQPREDALLLRRGG